MHYQETLRQHEYLMGIDLQGANDNLSAEGLAKLQKIILAERNLWNPEGSRAQAEDVVTCDIRLFGEPQFKIRSIGMNPTARAEFQERIDDQLRRGIIEKSCSPYASQVLLVPKPKAGSGWWSITLPSTVCSSRIVMLSRASTRLPRCWEGKTSSLLST